MAAPEEPYMNRNNTSHPSWMTGMTESEYDDDDDEDDCKRDDENTRVHPPGYYDLQEE